MKKIQKVATGLLMLVCVTLLTFTGGYTASAGNDEIIKTFDLTQENPSETIQLQGAYQLKVLTCENKGSINENVSATFCVLNIPNLQTTEIKSDNKSCGNSGNSIVSLEPIDDRTLVSCKYTQFKTAK